MISKRPSLALLLALIAPSSSAFAQAPYTLSVSDGNTYVPQAAGTAHTPTAYQTAGNPWDEGYATIALPFSVLWYGKSYDTIYAYTNGLVSFSPPPPGLQTLAAPSIVPSTLNPLHNYIAPIWANLIGSPTGSPSIRSLTAGGAPNRTFVIQYANFEAFNLQGASNVNFQVQFDEADGAIRVFYGPTSGVVAATAGLENDIGTLGGPLLQVGTGCNATCACQPRNCTGGINMTEGRVVTITPPVQADLIGSIDGPAGAYPSDSFTIDYTVSNVGNVPAAATSATLRISTDQTIDGSDALLATVAIPALAPRSVHAASRNVTMPALPPGRYYLGITVDTGNVVTEADEGNNVSIDPGGILTAADLGATRVFSNTTSGPGETLDVTVDLVSFGPPVAGAVSYDFYLSTDSVLDAGDTMIGSDSLVMPNGLAGTKLSSLTIPVGQMPSPPSYRVLVDIDPADAVPETDETNNVVASGNLVTLIRANLELEDGSLASGEYAFLGLPYPVTVEVANTGGAIAPDFTLCVLLSDNPTISLTEDVEIYKSPTITLRATESEIVRFEPVIPITAPTGDYFLGVVIDCDDTVAEADENDNTIVRRTNLAADAITVMAPAPDFVPLELMAPPSSASGELVSLALRLANDGVADGSAALRFVLSDDQVIEATDISLFETTTDVDVPAGQEVTVSFDGQVPQGTASGNYYVGVVVDPMGSVDEVLETNNSAVVGPISIAGPELAIVSPPPPNVIIAVGYAWRFFAVGGQGEHMWSASWEGATPAGLSFDAEKAELAGTTPTDAIGEYPFSVTVSAGNQMARADYVLRVLPPQLPLTVISGRLPPALFGEPHRQHLLAVGGSPDYRWAIIDGSLPPGLSLADDGLIIGRANELGAYTFEVEVTDSVDTMARGTLAIDVVDGSANVTITTPDIPAGLVGAPYSYAFSVEGGALPYRWTRDGPRIPGVDFIPGGALLTGTPTVAGTYPMVVEVKDGRGLFDRNAYVLEIFELGEITITTGKTPETEIPDGVRGAPYLREDGSEVRFEAELRNGEAPTGLGWLVVNGQLPPGLSLDTKTGVLSGTPSESGGYAFQLMAIDGSGDADRQTFSIRIDDPIDIDPGDEGCGCSLSKSSSSGMAWAWLLVLLIGGSARRRRPRG